jgi:hypothetical protein
VFQLPKRRGHLSILHLVLSQIRANHVCEIRERGRFRFHQASTCIPTLSSCAAE